MSLNKYVMLLTYRCHIILLFQKTNCISISSISNTVLIYSMSCLNKIILIDLHMSELSRNISWQVNLPLSYKWITLLFNKQGFEYHYFNYNHLLWVQRWRSAYNYIISSLTIDYKTFLESGLPWHFICSCSIHWKC